MRLLASNRGGQRRGGACRRRRGAAGQGSRASIQIDRDDIGGVVTGPRGPEAGVWVIAETTDLPTKFAKIVVTDDAGRYLVPDLPKANYSVWVRGYGLVDSPKVQAAPGRLLNLTATAAPNEAAAAQYYPPIYWFSMMQRAGQRASSRWRRSRARANGSTSSRPARASRATRSARRERATIPQGARRLREFRRSVAAPPPVRPGAGLHGARHHAARHAGGAADCSATGPIASPAGELPVRASPSGRAASSATSSITLWDWSRPTAYLHDEISTDRHNPRVNANGKIYGSPEDSSDFVPDARPEDATSRARCCIRCAIRRRRQRRPTRWRRPPTGAPSRSGTARR